jgi:glycosyltransferase involved in cell wall biosynthesis
VYDCIDPSFLPESRTEFDAREFAVARAARIVFCTAQTLLERMLPVQPHAYLLNNAASPELYALESAVQPSLPWSLTGRPRPIIGYIGTIDWRIDCDTLTEAAAALPEFTFCLVGRVNADRERDVAALRALPNVVMPGEVTPHDGAAYNAAFDVGLVPYLPGPAGDSLNPVKMYMYLLAGKPVVTTWTRECQLAQPHVRATRTPAEFIRALRDAVAEPAGRGRDERIAFAQQNTWDHRAVQAVAVLREHGLLPEPAVVPGD